MSRPTLVLVHGSWHCAEHFSPLIEDLRSHGYKCVPVSLPSTQSPDLPPATFEDDTIAIRNEVLAELDQNDVVVVAHSYGGAPTNNALERLDLASRSAAGAPTAVRAIVFLCSIPLPKGATFLNGLGGKPMPIHDLRTEDFTWVGQPGPQHYFYNDLSSKEAQKWSDLLRPQSWQAYHGELTYAAYMDIPSAYLYCTLDQAFPLQAQQGLVSAAKKSGAKFEIEETLEASHSPFLSRVEETSAFVRRVAEA